VPSLRTHVALFAALLMAAPASALAASGGVSVPTAPSAPTTPTVETPQKKSGTSSLDVTSFSLNGSHFFEYGRSIRATFQVSGRSGAVARMKLVVVQGGRRVVVADMGERPVNSSQQYTLPTAGLPSGSLELRLAGRDSRGRAIKGGPGARTVTIQSHRFPIVGAHNYGNAGARFGAPRTGHIHQGQDVMAAEGTPLVAVRGGTIKYTGDQPGGAGIYLVIDAAGEAYDYVYMHLLEGSLLVRQGQNVKTGQLVGKVGQTGAAEGPHLHFEVWSGVWQGGGKAIDPLPFLKSWDL
jgi:murein DD-endopeptidase MepM/ murein hydrolase activator NlpD